VDNPTTRRTVFRRPARFLALPVCVLAALALAGAATATPDGADTSTAPWIASDKPDYAPGERVTLDGGAWQPGEAVRIEVEDDQGKTWRRDTTVSADAAGTISDSFDLPDWFVATYSVTATGSSGAVATASFTDGNVVVRARVGGSPLAVTFPAGSARSFNNTACSGTAATSNASAFTTNGSNSNYTNSSVAATNSQSASIAAPSPITIAGTTYLFSGWSADSPAELTVSTSGTTGCFSRGPSQSNNPAWNMTATYVAAPTSIATTTTAASATATYGDDSVTLSATLTPASGPAPNVGTVTFTVRKGAATVGTATSGTVSGGSATATFPLSGVDADTYTVGAAYSGGTGFDPGGNSGQSPAPTLTVGPKALTGGFTAADKEYDGDADAEIIGRSLDGTVAGDDVALTGGSASFDDEHAGIDKPVTGVGFTLAGADKDNYTLGPAADTTASISPLGATGSFTAADKEYDGSTDAEITGRSLTGTIPGDDVALTGGSASFDDEHAGTDKPVTGSGFALAGGDMDNYVLASVGGTTASISPKPITGSVSVANKEYDGTASATITGRALEGTIEGDEVELSGGSAAFADKNVGESKPVSVSGASLAGADGSNYELGTVSAEDADITPLGVTGSFTAADKEYDGSAAAEITGRSLTGTIPGDDVALTGGSASFDDKHADTDKPVTGTGFALAGADKDNYTLGSVADTIATIARRALGVGAQGVDKVYDGSTGATVTLDDDRVGGDVLAFAYSASFADKHVGDDKPVTVSGISIAGADAGNYELAGTTATTSADITPRPLAVSATGVDKVYDGTTAATVVLATDEVGGDDVTAAYTTASFTDPNAGAGKTVNVGGISISGDDAGNYDLSSTTATATADIAPRPITVAADAKSKPFGAPDPVLTYAVSGGPLVSGDGFSGDLTRVAGEAVGGYDILQGTVSAGPNYAVAYVEATLTIGAWHALGFHQPIGIPNSLFAPAGNGGAPAATTATVWNTAKGGSTIPLKFNVYESAGGVEKTSTADVQSFTSARLGTCTAGAANDPVEELASAGSTTLRYDTTEKQFVQNWKTPSVAAESCYRVALTLRDGSALYAFVKLRK